MFNLCCEYAEWESKREDNTNTLIKFACSENKRCNECEKFTQEAKDCARIYGIIMPPDVKIVSHEEIGVCV